MSAVPKYVAPGFDKDDILAAEITPPFSAHAQVQWAWVRPSFEREHRLVAVDARRLPSQETPEAG